MATKSDSKFSIGQKYQRVLPIHNYLQTYYTMLPRDWASIRSLWVSKKATKSGKSMKEQTGSGISFTVIRVAAVNSSDEKFISWARDIHTSVKDPAKRAEKLQTFEAALVYEAPTGDTAPAVKQAMLPDLDSPVTILDTLEATSKPATKKPAPTLPDLSGSKEPEVKTPEVKTPAKTKKPNQGQRITALEGSIAQILALLQSKK